MLKKLLVERAAKYAVNLGIDVVKENLFFTIVVPDTDPSFTFVQDCLLKVKPLYTNNLLFSKDASNSFATSILEIDGMYLFCKIQASGTHDGYYNPEHNVSNRNYSSHALVLKVFFHQKDRLIAYLDTISKKVFSGYVSDYTAGKYEASKLDSVCSKFNPALHSEQANLVFKDLGNFLQDRDKYEYIGQHYKRTYLLHGVPGTGKTNLVRELALSFELPVIICSISGLYSTIRDTSLLRKYGPVIYQIDDLSTYITKDKSVIIEKNPGFNDSNVSIVLNTLDGSLSRNNVIIFFTSNSIDNFPEGFLRSQRINFEIEIPKLTSELALAHFRRFYRTNEYYDLPSVTIADLYNTMLKSSKEEVVSKLLVFK